jgi:hypothetical protein
MLRAKKRLRPTLLSHLALMFLCLPLFGACDAETQRAIDAALSTADGTGSSLAISEDTRVVGGEFDYGFNVTFTVTNVGEAGIVTVSPWLSCSEGEWSRLQRLNMQAGESVTLSYFFHEPTVNAANVYYGAEINP